MKKQETKEQKPISKKRKVFTIIGESFLGIFLVAVGVGGGFYLGRRAFMRTRNYSKYSVVEQDFSKKYEDYKTRGATAAYLTDTPVELVNIGLLNLRNSESFFNKTTGLVTAMGLPQDILAEYIKNPNGYFEENLSVGIISTGFRFYQSDDEQINVYSGSIKSIAEGATYQEQNVKQYETSAFIDKWGRKTLKDEIIYYIYDQTVLNSTKSKNSDGTYKLTFSLHPIYSVLKYVKQMHNTGSLEADPVFYKVNLEVTLDENLYIKNYSVDEDYQVVRYGMPVDTNGKLNVDYYYQYRDIPSLSEKVNYEIS